MNSILIVIPILTILMFDLGLTLEAGDFLLVFKRMKAVVAGMTGQLVALPLLAFLIAQAMGLSPVFTIGLVLIACCPGGSSSNVFSLLAGGDVALSVSLTAVSSIVTLATVPVILQWVTASVGESIGITLPVGKLLIQNLLTMLLPILLGIGVRHWWRKAAERIEKVLSRLAFPALMLLAGIFFVQNRQTIADNLSQLGVAVTVLLLCAIGVAAVLCRLFRLETRERRTIVIEVGMQNAAQAIAIASSPFVLNDSTFAIPAILYALMMNIVLLIYVGRIKFVRKGAVAMLLVCAVTATAQENAGEKPLLNEITLNGGLGSATPWGAKVNLNLNGSHLKLKPYIGVEGVNGNSSAIQEDITYRYPKNNKTYTSTRTTSETGTRILYGADAEYIIDKRNTVTAALHGTRLNTNGSGWGRERMYDAAGNMMASVTSQYDMPSIIKGELEVEAGFTHRTLHPGETLSLNYKYTLGQNDEERLQRTSELMGWDEYQNNYLSRDEVEKEHNVQFSWLRPLGKAHAIGAGALYTNRRLESSIVQLIDNEGEDETFTHRMQTTGVYAEYRLKLKQLTGLAKVEYDYTDMAGKSLNDVIPTARLQWQMTKTQSLTLAGGMRVIRPGLALLDPAHIRSAFAIDYGTPTLEGIHAKSINLTYGLRRQRADFKATLQHIFTNDGFNAIWMVRDYPIAPGVVRKDSRVNFTQNEGVRRAWSLTPETEIRPCEGTTINASATLIWDKRVAEAISLANEHWGITTHLALTQRLPLDLKLGLHWDYSEGNTQDLYSHAGRYMQYGASLSRSFFRQDRLTITARYAYTDYARIIMTQEDPRLYMGVVNIRPREHNAASLTLGYKF